MKQLPAIVFCPCCASAIDVIILPHVQQLVCDACEQEWEMLVDADRLAEHSLT